MTKKKNKSSKLIVLLFVVILICSIFITEIITAYENKIKNIDVNRLVNDISSGNESLVLLTKNDCSKCDEMLSILEEMKETNLDVYTINVEELSDSDRSKLSSESSLITIDSIPSVIHLSAGTVIGNYTGAASHDDIVSFERTLVNKSVADFEKMFAEDNQHFFYVGRPTCHYCVQSEPWAKRVAYETKKNIYYINIDEETSSDLQKLATLTGGLYRGATPLFMIVKKGKVLDYREGIGSYEDLLAFFNGSDNK